MKLIVLLLVAVAMVSAKPMEKRFLFDTLLDLFGQVEHIFIDPVIQTVGYLVGSFSTSVGGRTDIHTVACKLSVPDGTSRDEKINSCARQCISEASVVLGDAAADATTACPIACQYVVDHPDQVAACTQSGLF